MELISRKEAKELGLKRYFTGKPCKHGHLVERTVGSCGCIACSNKSRNANRAANKQRYQNQLDAWRKENKDQTKKKDKERYEKDKAYFSEKNARWHRENPEKAKLKVQRRKAAKLNQSPSLTKEEDERMNKASLAALCFSQVTEWSFHLDHIHPISRGGLHHPDNIQVLEASTNISKHNLTREELFKRDGNSAERFFNGLPA